MKINKKLEVLVCPSDRTGVGAFRSTNPHLALENKYPDEFHVDIDYHPDLSNDEFLKKYDIIHYHRTLGPYEQMIEMNERLKNLGVVSIMDIDDYWAPGQHHPAYDLIKKNFMDLKVAVNIKHAQYITTTTPIFAAEIAKTNKNVFVLPNAIDPTEKQFIPNPEPSDRIRIGWLGGSSHEKDLDILKGVVNRLRVDGLINKVQFVLCGFDLRGTQTDIVKIVDPVTGQPVIDPKTGKQMEEVKTRDITPMESVWYRYEKIFTDDYQSVSPEYKAFLLKFNQAEYPNVKNEPYRRVWTKPITTYANNYNLFDISLAPLAENLFNKVKSQLKVIESGFHKKALIAQNFGPYQIDLTNAIEFGGGFNIKANAILVDTKKNNKDWYNAIKKLINNPEMISRLQNNLHSTVVDRYSVDKVTDERRELYKTLINKQGK